MLIYDNYNDFVDLGGENIEKIIDWKFYLFHQFKNNDVQR